jgi:hypothetical protein
VPIGRVAFGTEINSLYKTINMSSETNPIKQKEEIKQNPDNKIDQDFNGYPSGPAKDETINPKSDEEKKTADLKNKDGEKRTYKKNETDEQDSDGSAKAFDDK